MGFAEAVRSCLQQYAGFNGRAPRAEYWYFVLFNLLAQVVAAIFDSLLDIRLLDPLVSLGLLLPGLAAAARRMHDTDRSGWWVLISLIPVVGTIWWIIWACRRGTAGVNRFGGDPLLRPPGAPS